MRPQLLLLAALLVAPSTTAFAKPAPRRAESTTPSSRIEADARAAIKRGDLSGAAAQLRKAREADPNVAPAIVLLHAQIYAKAGDLPRAMRAYQDFLRLAGPNASMKERGEAVARIQDYSAEVGAIMVRAKPEGARVLVDGEPIGVVPLSGPVPVGPGTHVVSLQGTNVKKTVKVKADESVAVDLEGPPDAARITAVAQVALAPPPEPARAERPEPIAVTPAREPTSNANANAPGPAPVVAPPDPNTRPDLDVPPSEHALSTRAPAVEREADPATSRPGATGSSSSWIGWSTAGVLAAGAIASGVLASGALGDYEAKKGTFGVTRDELEAEQGRAKLWSGVSIGLGAAAITTAAITFFASRRASEPARLEPVPARPSASVRVAPGFVGVGGTFR